MRHLLKKNKELIKRIVTYSAMVMTVIVSVVMVTFMVLGFRFNLGNGEIEQYSFLRFSSVPSGATVTVDGIIMSAKTPNKGSVKPGLHKVVMEKGGYNTWSKTIDVASGTLKWLNYTLFVPKTISVETVSDYPEIYSSSTSSTGRVMLVQPQSFAPAFDLIDLASDKPKTTKLVLPEAVYSEPITAGIIHDFQIQKWDDSGRYVIVKHIYGDKFEWLSLDTQNIDQSQNITRIFDINISEIGFSGTNGNNFFVIDSGDLRKLDLAEATMSRSLVSNVSSISTYGTNIVVYAGKDQTSADQVIGLYRDGDESSYVLRTLSANGANIKVVTYRYFNEDYIAYSYGRTVSILGGTYPTLSVDSTTSMKPVATFDVDSDIIDLNFSPAGEFVLARSAAFINTYDLEYQSLVSFSMGCPNVASSLGWLNDNYIWSTCDDSLVIREFDGENSHTINAAVSGQTVQISHNGKYLYSIGKTTTGYQLQRVRMILP